MAPDSKLPTELIREFILLCILDPCKPYFMLEENDPRLQITQICSSWRKVAFGIPDLWNLRLYQFPGESTVNFIAAWFRQCSNRQIIFNIPGDRERNASFTPGPLTTAVIIPYAHRFKTLYCHATEFTAQWSSLTLNALTTLSLRFSPRPTRPEDCITAPFLRNLEVTNILSEYTISRFLPSIHWEQLTSISLYGSVQFGDIYELLSLCTSLERCKLDSVHDSLPNKHIPIVAALNVPHLRELWIRFALPQFFQYLFSFNPPNLVTLAVSFPPAQPDLLQRFIAFIATSMNTIHSFKILEKRRDNNCEPVEEVMHALPLVITRFIAKGQPISRVALVQIGAGELLPYLNTLEFGLDAGGARSINDALDILIPQRPDLTTHLIDIRIHTYDWPGSYPSQRIQALSSQGINIHILRRPFYSSE